VSHMVLNESGLANDAGDYLFNGVHMHNKLNASLSYDAYVYNLNLVGSDFGMYTAGAYVKGNEDQFFYEAQVAAQFGGTGLKTTDNKDISFGGLYYNAVLGYALEKNASLSLSYEHLSGDDNATDDKSKVFSPFAGTNHKFNGFMDRFYVGNHNNKFWGGKVNGLNDIMLRLKVNSFMLDLHHFSTDVALDGLEKSIGNEIDLTYKYKHSKYLNVVSGASVFLFGDDYKNSSDKNDIFLYTMLIVNL